MAEVVALPLKKPSDVDVVKPLGNLISATFSTADNPEDYSSQIQEFSKLRNHAIWKAFEKYESSLEVIYRYYDQLHALEAKIPPTDVQIPFKWKDAFNKGSLFGGRVSLTISSLSFERVCVLYNIAALQSAVAANQSLETNEGLKLAAKLFQQSAGILLHLKNTVIGAIQVEPTPDLNPETLHALSSFMLAQAQEVFVYKAMFDRMKEAVIAKLCIQCSEFYAEAMMMLQKDSVRQIIDKNWIPLVAGKQAAFIGLAQYFQSIVCKGNKEIGEEIARLQTAIELLKSGQQRSSRTNLFQDYVTKAERALADANKDNDFIYHDRIPDSKHLPVIQKAALAKPLPIPEHFSTNFTDLFAGLVPMPVHQALAAYEVRKAELVNREINELRAATQFLNGVLASLNLPAALEDTSGEVVPQSLVEKSVGVSSMGGLSKLDSMISELPELLQRNTDILNEAERMLTEEEASDNQLKEQFKQKWNRTPSAKLTETFKSNIAKYREIINTAINADKMIRDKFEAHKRGMGLLSGGVESVKTSLPHPGSGGTQDTDASRLLRGLMDEVETLKAERDTIEGELKSATTDMKEKFLMSLADHGSINETAMSTEALGRSYGSLQQQVKESLSRQQTLLARIQEANNEMIQERSGSGGSSRQERDVALKELAAAYDAYVDLQRHLTEGTTFYNDLTSVLLAFQNKVSDFCFARKTEKEELMKDLTQDLSRGASDSAKKEPPARPPPPQFTPTGSVGSSATLPYPLQQPQIMPMPYAQPSVAPYPAYAACTLPTGYNPYATIAGYPHHPQPSQQQQQQQQQQPYAAYPHQPYTVYPTYPGPGYQNYPYQEHKPMP
uniref:Putative programmed cell death protein n=1 Tax=Panstrongylus megistus TaxID=65343 RepID=A0A069DX83_9HEMI